MAHSNLTMGFYLNTRCLDVCGKNMILDFFFRCNAMHAATMAIDYMSSRCLTPAWIEEEIKIQHKTNEYVQTHRTTMVNGTLIWAWAWAISMVNGSSSIGILRSQHAIFAIVLLLSAHDLSICVFNYGYFSVYLVIRCLSVSTSTSTMWIPHRLGGFVFGIELLEMSCLQFKWSFLQFFLFPNSSYFRCSFGWFHFGRFERQCIKTKCCACHIPHPLCI